MTAASKNGYTALFHKTNRSRRYINGIFAAAVAISVLLAAVFLPHDDLTTWTASTGVDVPRNAQLMQSKVIRPLREGKALRVGIVGGSISAWRNNYGDQLVAWLNRNWPAKDGSKHSVINAAISASESGLSSICLRSMFVDPKSDDSTPPVDLLIVEFAFNDYILPLGEGNSHALDISKRANFERIFRTALSWPVPVIAVENAGLDGDLTRLPPSNKFFNTAGADEAPVIKHYGVPVVDFAQFLYAWPNIQNISMLIADHGIHPSEHGHSIMTSLLIRELLFHMWLGVSDGPLIQPPRAPWTGPTWIFPSTASVLYEHGLALPAFDKYRQHFASWTSNSTLSPLPPARWQLGKMPEYSCIASQLWRTRPMLNQSVAFSSGFDFMSDVTDGRESRSGSRPGYTSFKLGSQLVYRLSERAEKIALLYRRSWQPSADAWVWVDQDEDRAKPGSGPNCPAQPMRLKGRWNNTSTQMVINEICPGRDAWSSAPIQDRKKFLHVYTIEDDGEGLTDETTERGQYFKSYGFATSQ